MGLDKSKEYAAAAAQFAAQFFDEGAILSAHAPTLSAGTQSSW